jgi:hypothetical protein
MNRIAAAAFAALLGVGLALQAHGAPNIDYVTVSDAADGEAASVIAADAAKIFVHGDLLGVVAGSRIRTDWIAVEVRGVQPDYTIDTTEVSVVPRMHKVMFSLAKPSAGWPVGSYRVDLYIDGKLATKAAYRVE